MFQREHRHNTLNGILFVALFATSATYISEFAPFKHIGISPLIVGIVGRSSTISFFRHPPLKLA